MRARESIPQTALSLAASLSAAWATGAGLAGALSRDAISWHSSARTPSAWRPLVAMP